MNAKELLERALKLFELELRDHQPLPALATAYQRGEQEFEHRPLVQRMRDHLGFPPLFPEQTLEEVGGASFAPVGTGQPKMRDLGLEVIQNTSCGARVLTLIASNELLLGQLPACAAARQAGPGVRRHRCSSRAPSASLAPLPMAPPRSEGSPAYRLTAWVSWALALKHRLQVVERSLGRRYCAH